MNAAPRLNLPRKRAMAIFFVAAAIWTVGFVSYYWLTMPYDFAPQRRIATAFIHHVNQGEFEKAFELAHKNMYTGKTLEDFKNKALREVRDIGYLFAYAHTTHAGYTIARTQCMRRR